MSVIVVVAPDEEPVTLTEAKAQCRVDISTDDALITALITAAREWCEKYDWRAYITQTIEFRCDAWPSGDYFKLPRPPLQEINSVTYIDEDGVEHTLDPSIYEIDPYSEPGGFFLLLDQSWPSDPLRSHNAITVNYTAGFGAAEDVPLRIKQAMLLLIGHWYENRESVLVGTISKAIEFGVLALLGVDRAMRF